MDSILFWLVVASMTLTVTGLMVTALRRGSNAIASAQSDLQVFRDQLREVERDLARGVINEEDAQRLRTEIGRRVLVADAAVARAQAVGAGARGPGGLLAVLVIAAITTGGALAMYVWRGAPMLPDMPMAARMAGYEALRAQRLSQQEAQARMPGADAGLKNPEDPQHAQLMDQLRAIMVERPDDIPGWQLLVRNEAMLGNAAAAAEAQARINALKGDGVTATDLSQQAELMIMAAGGLVTPQTEAVLGAALARDPSDKLARYYSGVMFLQLQRPDLAFRHWAPLWEESAPTDPWVEQLGAQLPDVAWLAGQHRYALPAVGAAAVALPGPDAAAMEAAADMTPAERQQMIEGMVQGLMQRLAAQGGSAEEWARLIRALGVLGDEDRARSILIEARERFDGRADEMAMIEAAATAAGLAKEQ